LHAAGKIKCTHAENTRAEVVTDPVHAEELYQRHLELNKQQAIARALCALAMKNTAPIRMLRDELQREGGFLYNLSKAEIERRIEDPEHFAFAHTGGSIYDENMKLTDSRWVADMHVEMPDDDKGAELVTSLPDPDDEKAFHIEEIDEATRIVRLIQENPAIAACIDNVSVSPTEYRQYGFASLARQTLFDHIQENINVKRTNKIRWLIAKMFRIRGINILGKQLSLKPSVANLRSIQMHRYSQKFPGVIVGEMPGDDIPVQIPRRDKPPLDTALRVGWETIIMGILRKERG
jgi:hypothetical protein